MTDETNDRPNFASIAEQTVRPAPKTGSDRRPRRTAAESSPNRPQIFEETCLGGQTLEGMRGIDLAGSSGYPIERVFGNTRLADGPISRYHLDTLISPEPEADKLVRVPIGFPEDLYEWMRAESFRRRSPMAEIVREALRDYREKQDPQIGLWQRESSER